MREGVYDPDGASEYLGIPKLQVKTLAKRGKISYCRLDRLHWQFAKRDLDAFLERRTYRAQTVFGEEPKKPRNVELASSQIALFTPKRLRDLQDNIPNQI